MRKLSNLFMVLSVLCFAVPGFAQGGEAGWRSQLGRDRRRIFHGVRFRHLRSGAGQSHGRGG